MNQRISNLRNKMKAQNLKAVLINNLKNDLLFDQFLGFKRDRFGDRRTRGPLYKIRATPSMPMRLVSPL